MERELAVGAHVFAETNFSNFSCFPDVSISVLHPLCHNCHHCTGATLRRLYHDVVSSFSSLAAVEPWNPLARESVEDTHVLELHSGADGSTTAEAVVYESASRLL